MGAVYKAHDARLDRFVAIKQVNQEFRMRFQAEARAIAALNHPHVCQLYDVGPDYLVMELVDGPTLAERIRYGAVPLDEALKIARQIAEALEAAHEKGIVHRDLKRGNIILLPDGYREGVGFWIDQSYRRPAVRRAPGGLPKPDVGTGQPGLREAVKKASAEEARLVCHN